MRSIVNPGGGRRGLSERSSKQPREEKGKCSVELERLWENGGKRGEPDRAAGVGSKEAVCGGLLETKPGSETTGGKGGYKLPGRGKKRAHTYP